MKAKNILICFVMLVVVCVPTIIQMKQLEVNRTDVKDISTDKIVIVNGTNNATQSPNKSKGEKKSYQFLEDNSYQYSGCYMSVSQKKFLMPLKSIENNIQIVNSLVRITRIQEYQNPSQESQLLFYSFPINPTSKIDKIEVKIGDIIIVKEINRKQNVRAELKQLGVNYPQNILQSSNITYDTQKRSVLSFTVGYLKPKSSFTITISYIQELKIAFNTFYALQMPFNLFPKIMNVVDGPSYTLKFTVNVSSTRKIIFYNSTTHQLFKLNQTSNGQQIILSLAKDQKLNKNFIFYYTFQKFHIPSYVVSKGQNTTTVHVSFIPKFNQLQINDTYNMIVKKKPQLLYRLDQVTGQYIFIIDRTTSMIGKRLQKTKQALQIFLRSLPEESYFNIISFGSTYENMYPQSRLNNNQNIQQAIYQIQNMKANLGQGNGIYDPLLFGFIQSQIQGFPKSIFLVTDGNIVNTEQTISMVKRKSLNTKLFIIGIGNEVSKIFIQQCAKASGGKSLMVADDDQISQKITQMFESSLSPKLKFQNIQYNQIDLLSAYPNPAELSVITKDKPVNIYYTYKKRQNQKLKFNILYRDSVSNRKRSFTVQINTSAPSYPFINKMAHYKVQQAIQRAAKDTKVSLFRYVYLQNVDLKTNLTRQAQQYSFKYQVVSQFTFFTLVSYYFVEQVSQKVRVIPKEFRSFRTIPKKPINYSPLFELVLQEEERNKLIQPRINTFRFKQFLKDAQVNYFINKNQKPKVDQIINMQNYDGSWNEDSLIEKLAKDPKTARDLIQNIKKEIIITKLSLLWLQQQKIGKQYSLIIKKAQNWLSKQMQLNEINEKQLNLLEIKTIPKN